MATPRDSFLDLEKRRLQLEENIVMLKKSLDQWRNWDFEYGILKDRLEAAPKPISKAGCAEIRTALQSEVLSMKEIDEILDQVGTKSPEQILSQLSSRQDYVAKTIETLVKQLDEAEERHAAVCIVGHPDVRDEEGAPITDIVEHLDDDDNVISSRLQQPGDLVGPVQQILDQAGVEDSQDSQEDKSKGQETSPGAGTKHSPPDPSPEPPVPRKKSVSFVDGPPPGEGPEEEPRRVKAKGLAPNRRKARPGAQKSRAAQRVEEIMRSAKEQESLWDTEPVIPEGESEEDAALRREMLQYGLGEVGAVVAEITLEEGSDDDEWDTEEDYDDDDDDDEHGRYTGQMVDDEYKQRMLELEKSLGIKSRFTEPGDESESGDKLSGLGRIMIKQDEEPSPTAEALPPGPSPNNPPTTDAKKGVRFADNLDIAPETVEPKSPPSPSRTPAEESKNPIVEPLSDVVERTGPARQTNETKKTGRVSRFKKNRDAQPGGADLLKGPLDMPMHFLDQDRPTAPTGPDGKTIAEAVVERDTPVSNQVVEGDFSEQFIDQDVATEYHRQRRNFINRTGGFLKEDESFMKPLDEVDGHKKMSKFKAARLSKQ